MNDFDKKIDALWQFMLHGPESFLKGKIATVVHLAYAIVGIIIILLIWWQVLR